MLTNHLRSASRPLVRFLIRGASLAFLAAVCDSQGAAPATRPNILILVADDIGVDKVGIYAEGSDVPLTPNIDSLASQGVLFRNAWTNPICSPTRAQIQTGRHSFRTGVGYYLALEGEHALQPAETTLPEMLDLGGEYAHAAFGKWHLGNETVGGLLAPNVAGYSHFEGSMQNFNQDVQASFGYFEWPKVTNGVETISNVYATSDTVDSALRWLATAPEPWLCYVAFHAAHTPLHAPPADLHSYDLSDPGVPDFVRLQTDAMVEAMDTEIGRLLQRLGEQRDRTTVFFLGDNGTGPGAAVPPFPKNHGKGTLFEGGVNVPFLVSGASVSAAGESAALVSSTDLFATIAEFGGIDPATQMPGVVLDSVSLVPYLADPSTPSLREFVFAEKFRPNGYGVGVPPGGVVQTSQPGDPPFCQEDLGAGGPAPGSPRMTMCGSAGQTFTPGNWVELRIRNAPANTFGWIAIAHKETPTPLWGGVLLAFPPVQALPFMTNAQGQFVLAVSGDMAENNPIALVAQAVLLDSLTVEGFSMSNAIGLEIHSVDSKAIRDVAGYKLVLTDHGGKEQMYDLSSDPFETVNLVELGSASLTPEQLLYYQSLKAQVTLLLQSEAP